VWLRCSRSPAYFLDRYVLIYDATAREWIPFRLWREQFYTVKAIDQHRLVVVLKARQLGLTWLVLGFALWLMLFRAAATVLIFSKRDDEAVYLLDDRLKGMYERLPAFLQARAVVKTSGHEFELSNGSVARAFPTTAGDSYTATMAIVDEADLVPDLNRLMRAVKPTIDGGGRMVLVSKADKSRPRSEFKRIYRAAKAGLTEWVALFLPWWVRPERDEAWYERQRTDIVQRTGSEDDLFEQYPATDVEALSARMLDKRIAPSWLNKCYEPLEGPAVVGPLPLSPIASPAEWWDDVDGKPAIPGLRVFRGPEAGHLYGIGVDPAEGNPNSDDSAIEVVDLENGEEMASLAGKFEPSTTAGHADRLGRWYNGAALMVERNNHGHAVLLWLRDNSRLRRLPGRDGKEGWLDNSRGKVALYDNAADVVRDGDTILHDVDTMMQVGSIEGSSLRAPGGEHDDRADAFCLALLTRTVGSIAGQIYY